MKGEILEDEPAALDIRVNILRSLGVPMHYPCLATMMQHFAGLNVKSECLKLYLKGYHIQPQNFDKRAATEDLTVFVEDARSHFESIRQSPRT